MQLMVREIKKSTQTRSEKLSKEIAEKHAHTSHISFGYLRLPCRSLCSLLRTPSFIHFKTSSTHWHSLPSLRFSGTDPHFSSHQDWKTSHWGPGKHHFSFPTHELLCLAVGGKQHPRFHALQEGWPGCAVRHGPSSRDVDWTEGFGTPAMWVPSNKQGGNR